MRVNYALGQLNPVLYFEDSAGHISLPPTTSDALELKSRMSDRGYELREAGTLAEVDKLQKRMQDQEYRDRQSELERDETLTSTIRNSIRDRLYARMTSSSTRQYEKDFIRGYLQLRDEKREKYRKRFLEDVCYFTAREFDSNHRVQTLVDRIPDAADEACTRCGKYRRVGESSLCLRCLGD